MYSRVNQDIISALSQIVGAANVLASAEALEPYTHDEVVGLRAEPEVVARAETTRQVSQILKLAQEVLEARP